MLCPPGDLGSWADRNPLAGRIADGVVYGRGACDMKGGLVSALLAVRALQ
ncbi:M20/M25/M40 family metallo-hydrolase [Jatrophihabitans lederbergiae]|uniref:M20/M25/M40 family metallo-hydrolase n=1 Tax=Jatrophihabitans lederbergiae TaxID=3075547 RepID=A0ABU2JEN2_9ACTN|nr:M20/M25/M40 family metallo-hydrolase [Jatrophihabitans sp. DSM 44399]MDT0263463.1 M20/M25/M40 family metallo-hydrolase [Jatrophihabitans sp. DSM 44399]